MSLPLVDYLDLPDGGHVLTEESHVISATGHVDLYELPKILSSATNATENVWLSVSEAAALITVEYDNGGTWTALTLTDTTPTADEYAVQCADGVKYPYSPRLLFHTDLAGASVRVTYTGLGSVPLAAWFTTLSDAIDSTAADVTALQEAVTALQEAPAPAQTWAAALHYDGTLMADVTLGVIARGVAWTLTSFVLCVNDPGTAGATQLRIQRIDTLTDAVTDVISVSANRPRVAASVHPFRLDWTPAADCTETTFAATDVLLVTTETVATDAATLCLLCHGES